MRSPSHSLNADLHGIPLGLLSVYPVGTNREGSRRRDAAAQSTAGPVHTHSCDVTLAGGRERAGSPAGRRADSRREIPGSGRGQGQLRYSHGLLLPGREAPGRTHTPTLPAAMSGALSTAVDQLMSRRGRPTATDRTGTDQRTMRSRTTPAWRGLILATRVGSIEM